MIFINKNIHKMIVIVNESQYNKILKEEQDIYNFIKKLSVYTADVMVPRILYLEEGFSEDVFTEKNLLNKLREEKINSLLPIESIIINIFKNTNRELVEMDIKYNPYWSTIVESRKGNECIIDAEFDVEVSLPSHIDDVVIENIYTMMVEKLTESLLTTQKWFKKNRNNTTIKEILKEQLSINQGITISDADRKQLVWLNTNISHIIYNITGKNKNITIKGGIEDNKVKIKDDFSYEEVEALRDHNLTHTNQFHDMKNIDSDTLEVSLTPTIVFEEESIFTDKNLDKRPKSDPLAAFNLTYLKPGKRGWGKKMHPIKKVKKMHYGQDYSVSQGTKIVTLMGGEVVSANIPTTYTDCGGRLIIKFSDGTLSGFCHLSAIKVKKGDKISRGSIVALSGGKNGLVSSGASTGPHIHYTYRPNSGSPLEDPKSFADKYWAVKK